MGKCAIPVVTIRVVRVDIEYIRDFKRIYFGILTVGAALSAVLVN
jgi:hypothetical protein